MTPLAGPVLVRVACRECGGNKMLAAVRRGQDGPVYCATRPSMNRLMNLQAVTPGEAPATFFDPGFRATKRALGKTRLQDLEAVEVPLLPESAGLWAHCKRHGQLEVPTTALLTAVVGAAPTYPLTVRA